MQYNNQKTELTLAEVCEAIANGTWAAFVAVARAFGEDVPAWNGCHDGQRWTPEQLRRIAARTRELYAMVEIIEDLAANGGARIS